MIPIKIDDKNIDFRNLHFNKIYEQIKNLLISKRNSYPINSFEYKTLDWIEWNLYLILNGETNKLKGIIKDFNYFLLSNEIEIKFKFKKIFTNDDLKFVCKINDIKGRSKPKNKKELIRFLIKNKDKIKNIDNLILLQHQNKINPILEDIFINFYEKEWDKIKDYDRYTFVDKHKLKTCPYCNRNYIFIVDENTGRLRPEIDHFFPKSKYPYLAMSFYNLIPSCQICNHTKKDKDTYEDGLLSPYEIEDNTFQLTYIPKNINFFQIKQRKCITNKSFEIKFKKIDKHSNKYFKLDKLYEQHKDIVYELLIKKTIYSKSYIAELKKNFHFTDDEIYRFLFCNYKNSEEHNKRPLSKLIKDISKELNLTQ